MKKFGIIIAALLVAGSVYAETRQHTFSATTITTNQGTSAQIVKGVIKNIYFDVPTGKTGGVSIVSSEGFTVFAASGVTTDTVYAPRIPLYTTAGAAITELTTGDGSTNAASNVQYGELAVAGTLTATFIPAANTTGTNTYRALITFVE